MAKKEICPGCLSDMVAESLGWRCKNCRGFISLQDGKFYEYVEKPFMPPMTNADRIRSMSDEELASFIASLDCPDRWRECNGHCDECVLGWLKEPAEE